MDLIGRKFGKLTVVEQAKRKGYVLCKCDCGNTKEIRADSLTKKKQPTRSCGCIQRARASENGSKNIADNAKAKNETNMAFKTNFQVIENPKLPRNNRSGHKGVWFEAKRQQYQAFIQVHGTRIHLGRFAKYEDAVKARIEAEEKYFAPLIKQKGEK
jgi:hypothetical protein